MLHWVVTFFVLAIIAALLGFTGIAAASAGIAQIIFYIFALLFVLSFFFSYLRRR